MMMLATLSSEQRGVLAEGMREINVIQDGAGLLPWDAAFQTEKRLSDTILNLNKYLY